MAPTENVLNSEALDQVFRQARTHYSWLEKPVPVEMLQRVYDLTKWGPTSANSSPGRFVFVMSPEAKARLRPSLASGNVEKTMAAPVTVIVAYDLAFHEQLPKLFPHLPQMRTLFAENRQLAEITALRNSTLQGAYLMIAARSLGLDCGPMSGFDNAKVDAEFFPDSQIKSNFLCNLGYGDASKLRPRAERLDFSEACTVL